MELLERKGVSASVSLGYRQLFPGSFLEEVDCEMYNLHPSLPPTFEGLEDYNSVSDRGFKVSGATLRYIGGHEREIVG